jgi:hypothetical protein
MFSSGCVYAELVTHVLMSERILKREGRLEPATPKHESHNHQIDGPRSK